MNYAFSTAEHVFEDDSSPRIEWLGLFVPQLLGLAKTMQIPLALLPMSEAENQRLCSILTRDYFSEKISPQPLGSKLTLWKEQIVAAIKLKKKAEIEAVSQVLGLGSLVLFVKDLIEFR